MKSDEKTSSTPPEPQTLRDGRYVLLRTFGEGAQGKTYDAVDKREGRAVVIKRLEMRDAKTWKDLELGEREVNVLRTLSHPKLPAYFEHFEEDGALFLVMQKIEGESLGALKRAGGALDEKGVRQLLRDAKSVLSYLHGRTPPVIHRDLKPGNVIRRPDGTFAFVDFGSVRDKLRAAGGSTVVGTFGYMAPEQFQGRALPASDVYAIGATAITLLTGTEPEDLPHEGLGIDVRAALKGTAVSEELTRALERMLEPDPDARAAVIPVLDGAKGDGAGGRRDGVGVGDEDGDGDEDEDEDEDGERDSRSLSRKERRRAREARKKAKRAAHAARRAAHDERRAARRGGRSPVAWPIALIFSIALAIGSLAVWLALGVAVPLLLGLLSIFFARKPLRAAARSVSDAGARARERMRDAQKWMYDATKASATVRVDVRAEDARGGEAANETRVAGVERSETADGRAAVSSDERVRVAYPEIFPVRDAQAEEEAAEDFLEKERKRK